MTPSDFAEIVDGTYEALYRFALSLSRDPNNAADLTQQAFFVLAEKGGQLRDRTKAKSWLFTTLHREFLRTRRRAARETLVDDTEPLASEWPDAASHAAPARALDGHAVVDALGRLDEIYRAPLTLFYLQQVSYKEIAAILDVPIGTVMSRLSRGKEQLRRMLGTDEAGSPKVVPFPGRRADAPSAPASRDSVS